MATLGAEFELTSRVLVRSFGGWGVQLNQHTYAAISGIAEGWFHDLEEKVVALAPQLVRLFYNDRQEGDPADPAQTPAQRDNWRSLVRTAKLAQEAHATINVTWQSGRLVTRQDRQTSMACFAGVLERLATTSGISNLRWVTIQNEPNGPPKRGQAKTVTPERLGEMYELLDELLTRRGLREQIRFMGGDLLEGSPDPRSPLNHRRWFEHMSAHLADLLDAYSVHIYWDCDDVARFQHRLTDVRGIVGALTNRKPVYVTECAIRGNDRGQKGVIDPGNFRNGDARVPLGETNIAAFQQGWFQIRAAQLGYAGTVKWDCHFGRYDKGKQAYYAIGAPTADGWPRLPVYFLLRLFTLTTQAGWQVREIKPLAPGGRTKQLVALTGPTNELTILGLDSRGATLNGTSATRVQYSVRGLPARTPFTLLLWNRGGGGKLVLDTAIATDKKGVARISAPLHGVFALTNRTLPLPID
jgi:hypothetical protein